MRIVSITIESCPDRNRVRGRGHPICPKEEWMGAAEAESITYEARRDLSGGLTDREIRVLRAIYRKVSADVREWIQ